MSAFLVVADHGELIAAVPFVMPAFLVVGAVLALRAIEKRRDSSSSPE